MQRVEDSIFFLYQSVGKKVNGWQSVDGSKPFMKLFKYSNFEKLKFCA